ncbi:MAG: FkbM family methyltransferase [Draconibacterium sp.]|nr:FkbM family methyltransferase [Draconibacterium sp.]
MSKLNKLKYYVHIKSDLKRRLKIIDYCNINTLFDIGANTGDYSKKMRDLGYRKRIISFEPLNDAFEILKESAAKDSNWMVNNYALGNENTKSVINISGNSCSSSILDMLPKHIESDPDSGYVGKQEINVKKLDSIFNSFVTKTDRVMVKIDTQGYEKNVIDGAESSLRRVSIIQLEMSIVPLYENELLFTEMIKYLESKGFKLYSLENGHYNRDTGQLLQVDGIFVNESLVSQKK